MTVKPDSARAVFDRLIRTDLPAHTPVLFDTACVLGGSIAGLLAARVLADHARRVVIIERDAVNADGRSRSGVPQDRQGHGLLPGGRTQLERWLPGFTREAQDLGSVLARPDQQAIYLGDQQQMQSRETTILTGTRPFLESRIGSRVLALPNVTTLSGQAAGLDFRDDAVRAVRHIADGIERALDVDFAVDAMGRSSKISDWVERGGYQRPQLQRLRTDINYATALFERQDDAAELSTACALARPGGPSAPDGISVAAAVAVEANQWMVMMMAYEPDRPPTSIEALRSTCAKLPMIFGHAVSGRVTRDIETYRQADSRRRDFTGLTRFPARLVSVGDAMASFNPVHGQGISSAALHASCLSDYLVSVPQVTRAATEFFDLQSVVTDAAWMMSAGDDAARLDAIRGVDVPEDVAVQRRALQQLLEATLVDQTVADAFGNVTSMLAHPSSLAEPALLERAAAANQLRATRSPQ
ncbi:FAD-dependent oxidoreductase [Mycobacterium sp. Dal123C01]|uniref:FAD-dependent oxidoreductase n=1 Tax=Mycobacterium sp. Dal123C01 TaxID=3457577 RepID=UPI00403E6855